MAAATAAREDYQSPGDRLSLPVKGSTTIYAGTLVSVNSSGYALPSADTASTTFMGVAMETIANSGSDGAKEVVVACEGTFQVNYTGTATQASVGTLAYASDDNTVAAAATTTNDILVGKVVQYISATSVRVKI